jgi:adenylosuccinate synthase
MLGRFACIFQCMGGRDMMDIGVRCASSVQRKSLENTFVVNQRKSAVILGAQWGDEGKGKIVDVLSEKFSVVARYAGGHNAGHTVIIKGKKFVLQLIPCGVLRPECKGVIGNGVVLDPMAFLNEVKKLKDAGLPVDGQLFVSNRAQVILPYHRMIELAAENAPGRTKIGTTSRGIGPAYEDKMHRSGLRVVDLLNSALLRTHIENACHEKNTIAHALFGTAPLDPKTMYGEYARAAEQIAPFVTDTAVMLNHAIDSGEKVMFEGAQGALLDIDHGTYPFVTSSSSTAGGAVTGTGVGPTRIGTVIGVTKAYVTRVGEGPFPTEIHDSTSDLLRARGQEYGAVTGRPRRCGWLDLPLLRYSNMINGTEWLVVTKMDVMDECAEIPVCTGYKINGKLTDVIPADMPGYNAIEPVYTKLKGWKASTEGITEFDKLPKLAQEYLTFVEKESGAKIGMVSTGPDRDQTMMLPEFDQALKA